MDDDPRQPKRFKTDGGSVPSPQNYNDGSHTAVTTSYQVYTSTSWPVPSTSFDSSGQQAQLSVAAMPRTLSPPQYRHYTPTATSKNTHTPPGTTVATVTPGKDPRLDVVCIGQITVTALILYPVAYICPQPGQPSPYSSTAPTSDDYVPVRLKYDDASKRRQKTPGQAPEKTIQISVPHMKSTAVGASQDAQVGGEEFGVVEQKIATVLGPLMQKVLIRLEAQVRRASSSTAPILPLRILVFTPRGNVKFVASYISSKGVLLEHPSLPYVPSEHKDSPPYENPHHPATKPITSIPPSHMTPKASDINEAKSPSSVPQPTASSAKSKPPSDPILGHSSIPSQHLQTHEKHHAKPRTRSFSCQTDPEKSIPTIRTASVEVQTAYPQKRSFSTQTDKHLEQEAATLTSWTKEVTAGKIQELLVKRARLRKDLGLET